MNKVIIAVITTTMSLATLYSAVAQNVGTTSAMFKPLVSPKVSSLGGAYSTFTDADSLLVNPASIARSENKEISVAYTSWLVETNYSYLSVVIPVSDIGSFGLAVNYFNAGDMDEIDSNGNPTGKTFTANGVLTSLVYSRNVTEKIAVGTGLKYILQTIEKETAQTPSLDLGTLFLLTDKLKVSVVLQNLFGSIKFINEENKLPLVVKIGGSYQIINDLITAIDVNVLSDNNLSLGLGVEYNLKFNDITVPLRAGYKTGVDALLGISLGAGVGYKNIVFVNLCWTPAAPELEQQTFNAGVSFKF